MTNKDLVIILCAFIVIPYNSIKISVALYQARSEKSILLKQDHTKLSRRKTVKYIKQILQLWRGKLLMMAIALAGLCTFAISAAPTVANWDQWRGASRDGISQETGWLAKWPEGGPKVIWEASVGIGYSSVSVVGDRLYTMGNVNDVDIVWCLDAENGKEIWRHSYPSKKGSYPGPRMTPTVDGDLVFTLAREGELFCLNVGDGSVRWETNIRDFGAEQTKFEWGFSCSPLVLGDLLILDVGKVLAFDKKKGSLVWQSGKEQAGCSSPVTVEFDGVTYVTSYNSYGLFLVNTATGKEFAQYEWPDPHGGLKVATPIISGDKIFISTCINKKGNETAGLFQINKQGLKPLVKNSNIGSHVSTCVLWQGYLYGFDGTIGSKGSLKCLDFETLEVKWSQAGLRVGSLMAADGKLIILCGDGNLICAEASPVGFEQLAHAKVLSGNCWTHPVLAGGRIYCRNHAGKLICLDVRGKPGR